MANSTASHVHRESVAVAKRLASRGTPPAGRSIVRRLRSSASRARRGRSTSPAATRSAARNTAAAWAGSTARATRMAIASPRRAAVTAGARVVHGEVLVGNASPAASAMAIGQRAAPVGGGQGGDAAVWRRRGGRPFHLEGEPGRSGTQERALGSHPFPDRVEHALIASRDVHRYREPRRRLLARRAAGRAPGTGATETKAAQTPVVVTANPVSVHRQQADVDRVHADAGGRWNRRDRRRTWQAGVVADEHNLASRRGLSSQARASGTLPSSGIKEPKVSATVAVLRSAAVTAATAPRAELRQTAVDDDGTRRSPRPGRLAARRRDERSGAGDDGRGHDEEA